MSAPAPTIITGAHVLDLDAESGWHGPVDITVEDGRIARLRPFAPKPEPTDQVGEVIDGRGMLAIPGLINAHFHSSGTLNRGLIDNLPLELFMLYELPPFGFRSVGPELYRARVLLAAVEMLRHGVTAVFDDPIYSPLPTREAIDAVMGAYEEVGLRATVTIYQPNLPQEDWYRDFAELVSPEVRLQLAETEPPATDEIIAQYEEFFARWDGRAAGRLRCGGSPSAPQRASDDYLVRLRELTRARGAPWCLHVYESKLQRVDAERREHSLIRRCRDLGVLDDTTAIVHGVWLDDTDLDDLAATGAALVHSPSGNLRCGGGVMPLRSALARRIPVALCTDEATVEDTSSLWSVARLTALVHKLAHPDSRTWPTAREVLTCLTAGGARAIGLEGQIGVLREGARADLCLLDLSTSTYVPLLDLPSHLVYGEEGASIRIVMVDGRVVVRDGEVLTVDERALLDEVRGLLPDARRAAESARTWAQALQPAFEEMVRRGAVADIGMNRWLGDDGRWLAPGRADWGRPRA